MESEVQHTSAGGRAVRDVVGPAPRVGEVGRPVKVRRLGRLGLDAARQVAVAVQVAAVEEAVQVAAADGGAQKVLQREREGQGHWLREGQGQLGVGAGLTPRTKEAEWAASEAERTGCLGCWMLMVVAADLDESGLDCCELPKAP